MTTPTEPVSNTVLDDQGAPELSVASTLVPYDRDDSRSRYFGYRCCGFSIREALQMISRSKQWLSWCRTSDAQFAALEQKIPEMRKELSKEYLQLDFYRNFRLALEKDYRVLNRSLGFEKDIEGNAVLMTSYDHEYLLKMRSQYSPQQLQILEAIVSNTNSGEDFASWVAANQEVVQMSRTDTVTVRRPRPNASLPNS